MSILNTLSIRFTAWLLARAVTRCQSAGFAVVPTSTMSENDRAFASLGADRAQLFTLNRRLVRLMLRRTPRRDFQSKRIVQRAARGEVGRWEQRGPVGL